MTEQKYFFQVLEDVYVKHRGVFILLACALFLFVIFSTFSLVESKTRGFEQYFLSVGQGDSELIVFESGAVALIDGGPPNGRTLSEIGKILPFTKRSLDLVFITHPEHDHFGGLIEILKRFNIGVVLVNGDENDTDLFYELQNIIEKKQIRKIVLRGGDVIKHRNTEIKILSPEDLKYSERNDNSLVLLVSHEDINSLFLGDIPSYVEEDILSLIPQIDILKVAHHGSKYSTSEGLLLKTRPKIAFIEVGKNSYGHPTSEVLGRLSAFNTRIFRTDIDGTLKALYKNGNLEIFRVK